MKKLIVLLVVIGLGVAIVLLYPKCIGKQEEKIQMLETKIELLKETHIPLRFKILEKTADSIHLAAKFYNAEDKFIKQLETKLAGQELSFDFYVVPVKDRYIAFPYKIFTNQIAPVDGIELYDYYDNNGFPEVFYAQGMDKDLETGLKNMFRQIRAGQLDSLKNYFGNMVHDIQEFKSFLPETPYSIVTHTKGGIEIIEE
jgi:hypothetical protein